MTGEISLQCLVKPIGGVSAKIGAAKKAGAERIIIPKDNWSESFSKIDGVKIIPVSTIEEVISLAFIKNKETVAKGEPNIIEILGRGQLNTEF